MTQIAPDTRPSAAGGFAVTAAACALAGYLGRRAALFAIPLALFWWAISGLGVIVAGIALGHSHTIEWGVVLLAAAVVGALVGLPIAARRG
jgi:Zn-dependent membrane protease YugP